MKVTQSYPYKLVSVLKFVTIALWKVIEVVFNWTNAEDRAMLTRTITHWADNLKEMLSSNKQRGVGDLILTHYCLSQRFSY